MAELFLQAKNICKTFEGVKALDNVDLSIEKGKIHCLVGENGSGKSTLIKIIGGVHRLDSGTISIDGNEYRHLQTIDSIRAGIQIIYQDLSLFPNLTVAENIAVNQMLESDSRVVNWARVRAEARKALAEIGEEIELSERVENLSIARKQIVAISRALTQNAKLIIMDEATSAITKEEVNHLFTVIDRLQKKGISILFVSHKLSEVFEIADMVTIIRDGKKVGDYPAEELDNERLVYLMTGKKFDYPPYRYQTEKHDSRVLLAVEKLSKQNQFSDVNFQLRRGEILGITGLIGSGRTEMALSLFGLNRPDSGRILLDGTPIAIRSPRDAIRHGIAYLPEDRLTQGLFEEQSIGKNIIVTILAELLGKLRFLSPSKQSDAGAKWVQTLKIRTPTAEAPANSLSGGNQQRVVLAKWLAIKPKVFILDGPTIGIDIGSKHNIHEIIRGLAEAGMAIIMISDEIQEILDNCNRVLIMSKGKLVKEIEDAGKITPDEVFDIISSGSANEVAL